MNASAEEVVRGLFAALNERDFERAAGAVAEQCEWESVAAETTHRGSAPIVAGLRDAIEAFPDWRVAVSGVVASADTAVVEWETSGTFQRAYRGAEPNGRRFRRRGCSVAEVRGGKIVRYRDYYDRATLLQQLELEHLL